MPNTDSHPLSHLRQAVLFGLAVACLALTPTPSNAIDRQWIGTGDFATPQQFYNVSTNWTPVNAPGPSDNGVFAQAPLAGGNPREVLFADIDREADDLIVINSGYAFGSLPDTGGIRTLTLGGEARIDTNGSLQLGVASTALEPFALDVAGRIGVGDSGMFAVVGGSTATANAVDISGANGQASGVVSGAGSRIDTETSLSVAFGGARGSLQVVNQGRVDAIRRITNGPLGLIGGNGVLEADQAVISLGRIAPNGRTDALATPVSGEEIGTLSVVGNYEQGASGVLEIDLKELAGNEAEHDVLDITGDAFLAGALEVNLSDDFDQFPFGASYEILSANSITGTFATLETELPGLIGSGYKLAIVYSSDAVNLVVTQSLTGDFNFDNRVDARDYTVWRDSLGSTTNLVADANLDRVVNQADYDLWAANYGRSAIFASTAVPEPTTLVLLFVLTTLGTTGRRRE